MKCVIENLDFWIRIIEYIHNNIDESDLIFEKDGLHIDEANSNHTAFVFCTIYKNFFKEYEITDKISFTINLEDYVALLKKANKMNVERLEITYNKTEEEMENVFFKPKTTKGVVHKLKVITRESERVDMSDLKKLPYTNKVSIKPNILANIVEQASGYDENVGVYVKDDIMHFYTTGVLGDFEYNIEASDEEVYSHSYQETDVLVKFELANIKTITNTANLTDKIDLSYDSSCPMRIDYNLTNKQMEYGKMTVLIASKNEDDKT